MFGIDIIDATLIPALTLAFLAGVISFLSPCVLPIVPPYLAYMSGISLSEATDKNKAVSVFLPAVFFRIGAVHGISDIRLYSLGTWHCVFVLSRHINYDFRTFGDGVWIAFSGNSSDWIS